MMASDLEATIAVISAISLVAVENESDSHRRTSTMSFISKYSGDYDARQDKSAKDVDEGEK